MGLPLTLGIVLVDDVARCFPERSHVDVARHADNHQVGFGRIRPAEDAAQRVPVWPVATGHGLADDGHGLRLSPIAFVEGAASHDNHAGRVEERTVHGGAIGAERLLAGGGTRPSMVKSVKLAANSSGSGQTSPAASTPGSARKRSSTRTRPLHRLVRSQTRDRHHDGQDRRRSPAEAGIDGQHLLPASQEQPGSHEQHE